MRSELLFTGLVLVVGLERVAELIVSRRHVRWALSQGAREFGQRHYPVMVVLHAGLLAGAVGEVWLLHRSFVPALGWSMLALVLGSQALRWWCIASLGPRWNTRVLVLPGLAPVTRGPYRLLRHPNYVAVALEGASLPLVHSAWLTALLFTGLNVLLLAVRIRVEERALAMAHPEAPASRLTGKPAPG
jgi:methyltransferase